MKRSRRRKLSSFTVSKSAKEFFETSEMHPREIAQFYGVQKVTMKEVNKFLEENYK